MTRGFTLIELVVVMSIIAILAGILVPLTYKSLERAEESATLQKMQLLKKAMVGDPQLIQNGIRTDFGFVGDIGELPGDVAHPDFPGEKTFSGDLVDAVASKLIYANWKGPYLLDSEPGSSLKDSWGKQFIYTVDPPDKQGRRVSATIRSAGPDGIPRTDDDIWVSSEGMDGIYGTADDIPFSIVKDEVTPAGSLLVDLSFNGSAPPVKSDYSVKFEIEYKTPAGIRINSHCYPLAYNERFSFTVPVKDDMENDLYLPIGRLKVIPQLYTSYSGCTNTPVKNFDPITIYVNDERMKTVPLVFSRGY